MSPRIFALQIAASGILSERVAAQLVFAVTAACVRSKRVAARSERIHETVTGTRCAVTRSERRHGRIAARCSPR